LPRRGEVIAVLGVVVFAVHSWSILGFLNKLSAFILYFRVPEIAEVFAFMMASALLESLLITAVLVLLTLLLPASWLREDFAYKSFVILIVLTGASIYLQRMLRSNWPSPQIVITSWAAPLAGLVLFLVLGHFLPRFKRILLDIQDRLTIMLYVYVPLGILSLFVVIFNFL
jgi:hypothetical protein